MRQVRLDKGTLIEGNQSSYRVISKIGSGGFGNIYKAVKLDTSEIVAIKTLKHHSFASAALNRKRIKRFEHEIDICAQMSHTNIIKLKDIGDIAFNEPFVVFEYIRGNTLKDILLKKGGLQVHDVRRIMSQVLFAIKHMHSKGIVHRDLKPQNIMIEESTGKVVLLDFGISRSLNNRLDDKKPYYEKCGTPAYAIPHQLTEGRADFYSDIYAWGLILIECFTGYSIIRGRSLNEIICQQLHGVDKKLPFKMFNVPLASLLSKVLSKTSSYSNGYENLFRSFLNIDFSSVVYKHGVADCSYKYSYLEQTTLIVNV